MSTEFIELAGKVNQFIPYHCLERIERALNDHAKPVKGSRILVLGASYKSGVGDMRESPAIRVMEALQKRGATISYHDEYVSSLPELGLSSVPLEEALDGLDAAALLTAHPGVDYDAIAAQVPLFIDFRGITRGSHAANVIRL